METKDAFSKSRPTPYQREMKRLYAKERRQNFTEEEREKWEEFCRVYEERKLIKNRAEDLKLETKNRQNLRQNNYDLAVLFKNPTHEMGERILHRIETGEIDFSLNQTSLERLMSFSFTPIRYRRTKFNAAYYYLCRKERKKEEGKVSYGKRKKQIYTANLNNKFSRKDSNRYLSSSDIRCPFVDKSNLCQRELFKIDLYPKLSKEDKISFAKKWDEEWQNYLKEVEELDEDFKLSFLNK